MRDGIGRALGSFVFRFGTATGPLERVRLPTGGGLTIAPGGVRMPAPAPEGRPGGAGPP